MIDTSAYQSLKRLADDPVDLRQGISKDRLLRFASHTKLLSLHYALERVDQRVLLTLQQLARETDAVQQFHAMAEGAFINQVEGCTDRPVQVLHLLNRLMPKKGLDQARSHILEQRRNIIDYLTTCPFERVVQIGIGGSELGPKAIYRALTHHHDAKRRLNFLSNVDPDHTEAVLQAVDPRKTLFVVVSKSGSTLETQVNERRARECLAACGLDPRQHMVAITTPGSKLDQDTDFHARFTMLEAVGGRFSATSPVGEFCLRFGLGNEVVDHFLAGAATMDETALNTDIRHNPSLLSALLNVWNHHFLGINNRAVLPYAHHLDEFVLHLQQCAMESNGKSVHRMGYPISYPTAAVLWGAPGTNSQHSFFQQLHQGTVQTQCTFLGFECSQSKTADTQAHLALNQNLVAQMVALACGQPSENANRRFEGNRCSRLITARQLNAETVGALLSFFENEIAYEGFLLGVNSFDQEGVQLGKVLATALDPEQTALREKLGGLSQVLLDAESAFLGRTK
ncbi:MAG: glucose-6-phosphate isomerase [Acidobacteria bacterium]|nr:glucose-6-phosphate isomerase [Acidobacteriota bacterium]